MSPFDLIIFDTYDVVFRRSPRYLEEELAEEADAASRDVVDDAAFWERFARRHRLSADDVETTLERLAAKYCKNLDVWKDLPSLRAGRRLLLLHGGPSGLVPRWQAAHDLDRTFAGVETTAARGISRADPALYAAIAASAGFNPDRCLLVVADRAPFEAARAAGLGAYRFGTAYGLRVVLADPALAFGQT